MREKRPQLTTDQILEWADNYHRRTGKWPLGSSGPISEAPETTWRAVDMALRYGHRGFPGRSSLGHLLHQNRGVPLRAWVVPW
jgi:hypothetical protein